MVDVKYSEEKFLPGVITLVKPSDNVYDVEVSIQGKSNMKSTWPSPKLYFCGSYLKE